MEHRWRMPGVDQRRTGKGSARLSRARRGGRQNSPRVEQTKGVEPPEPTKELSEAKRQRQIDIENRERLLLKERLQDCGEGQESSSQ